MQTNGMKLCLSTSTLSNTHCRSSCYPVSVEFSSRNISWTIAGTKKRDVETEQEQELKPLWDDGYGTQTVRDYIEAAKTMTKPDGGPPRWFCPVESGPPLKNSPLLLYLPGIDGVGMGMVLHHKAMGMVFQVRCMHVPVCDRTPYEDLVEFVGNAVKDEHASFPNKPIYLVADSFGGCLALSVAAANPTIDLVLILINPATSFDRWQVQSLLIPFLELLPEQMLPCIYGITAGDPIKMAKVINATKSSDSPSKQINNFIHELSSLLSGFCNLVEIFPKQALAWKLKLLRSGAACSNSCLNRVKNEVLILASGKDSILASKDEAQRLSRLLQNSRIRLFKENGHLLLLEDGINLLTVIKGNYMYRRSKRRDPISDFLPPSKSEFDQFFDQQLGLFRVGISPVMLSTLADGKIVRGLQGVPDHGPVLLVGYHMLFGIEIGAIVEEFLREKKVMVHGLAHPWIFDRNLEQPMQENSSFHSFKVFGAVPVSGKNLCQLLSAKCYALLYPGGVREALHRRGEAHKLFWPERAEFVRMAIKYGAKIVPFGVVGEDDIVEIFLDYNDQMRIPVLKEVIRRVNEMVPRVRGRVEAKGQVAEQALYMPGVYPKLPGRFYFLFGQPIEAEGREEEVEQLYVEVKSEVERSMAYLMKKREEDPCRRLLDRLLYRLMSAPAHRVPTFDP